MQLLVCLTYYRKLFFNFCSNLYRRLDFVPKHMPHPVYFVPSTCNRRMKICGQSHLWDSMLHKGLYTFNGKFCLTIIQWRRQFLLERMSRKDGKKKQRSSSTKRFFNLFFSHKSVHFSEKIKINKS